MVKSVYDISLSPRVRKTPFFERTVEAGLKSYTIYNHMMLPAHYGDHLAEYHSLMNDCCIWDVSAERQVEMVGPDAAALAQLICPRDLSKCVVGQGMYVPIVNHDGGMLNDPVLLKVAEDKFWLSLADGDLLLWVQAVAAARGMDVLVYEPDVSPLAIQGPKAMDVATDLFGDWVRELKYFWFAPAKLNDIPIMVARSGWSKQGGVEIYLMDGTRGNDLWDLVWEAGQKYNMAVGAPNQYERIESGLLSYGSDMDQSHSPFDIRLDRFMALDIEAEFIGKEALRRIRDTGSTWQQVGLWVDGAPLAYNHNRLTITQGDQSVGDVTAMIHSPKFARNIAIALLKRDVAAAGEDVIVHTIDGPRAAQQTKIPFKAPQ